MTTSALATPNAAGRLTFGVDQLFAGVHRPPHGALVALAAPRAPRAILHVAHSFADELAALDPRFDRVQFIREVTEDPS